MNVLIISQHFWPESFRINVLAEALLKTGCGVTVLTGQPNYPEGKTFPGYQAWRLQVQHHPSGYPIVRVPLVSRGEGSAIRLTLNYFSFIITSILLGSWKLRKTKFDVVFVYGTSPVIQTLIGVFFRAVRGARLILWVQDLWPDSLASTGYVHNRSILSGVAKVVGWIYRRCDLILVQSQRFIPRVLNLSGSTRVLYYPNPSDVIPDFNTSSAVNDVQLPAGFNVMFAGNVGTVQSVETILDAAERLKSVSGVNIVILGSGRRLDWMSEQTEKRSLSNVHLLGRVEPDVAIRAMSRSDALLISLKNNSGLTETVPSKLSTYLGVGRPIIASMGGEGADIVKLSGAGFSCEAENADELAEAILRLKDMPQDKRNQMGAAGRRWYEEHFELTKLTNILMGHFEEVTGRSGERDRPNG